MTTYGVIEGKGVHYVIGDRHAPAIVVQAHYIYGKMDVKLVSVDLEVFMPDGSSMQKANVLYSKTEESATWHWPESCMAIP